MNQTAIEMLSTFGVGVLCVVIGIMVLVVFFVALSRITSGSGKPDTMSVRGVLKKDTWARVYLSGTETFERVRFIGFTDAESMKTHIPFELHGMVILEDERGCRFLVRAKAIRMIVVEPEGNDNAATGIS